MLVLGNKFCVLRGSRTGSGTLRDKFKGASVASFFYLRFTGTGIFWLTSPTGV